MPDPIALKYRAFISYTHADARWAKWLHGRLEAFKIDKDLVGRETPMGPVPKKLRPIFRDRDEFTAGHPLTELTLAALDGSAALIVLCSPSAAHSHYVNEEIRLFKERHPERPIIPLILDGEPGDAQRECFPQALKFTNGPPGQITETPEEVLAADVREGADGKPLALARVIAGLLGLNTDDVFRRAERARRRGMRVRNVLIAVFAVLAVAATGGGVYAYLKQQEAVEILATSDFQQGTRALQEQETTADGLALLARAVRNARDERALTRLWTFFQQRSFWIPQGVVEKLDSVPPLEAQDKNNVPPAIAQRLAKETPPGYTTDSIAISGDGTHVLTTISNRFDHIFQMRVWNVDGTPVTEWFQPEFKGWHWLWDTRGYLSHDGRFLALEVTGWRETSYLEIRDLKTRERIGDRIFATGLGPHYQNMTFSHVEFITLPRSTDDFPRLLLLTAAVKGDVAVFRIDGDKIEEIVKNRHRGGALLATVDSDHTWLMSAGGDGTVLVSSGMGGPIGIPLRMESTVTQIKRVSPSGLSVTTQDGNRHQFELREPLKVPLPPEFVPAKDMTHCLSWLDDFGREPKKVLEHRSGRRIENRGPRKLMIAAADGGDNRDTTSRVFGSDIALACLDEAGNHVTVTTADFVTQIWDTSFVNRLGPPLDEKRLFEPGMTPEKTTAVQLTKNGNTALIESFLWNPPDAGYSWVSLWDTRTGLWLTDRIIEDSVRIDPTGVFLGSLQIKAPQAVEGWLPNFAEAVAGIAFDKQGIPRKVADRSAELREGISRLEKLEARK